MVCATCGYEIYLDDAARRLRTAAATLRAALDDASGKVCCADADDPGVIEPRLHLLAEAAGMAFTAEIAADDISGTCWTCARKERAAAQTSEVA